MIKTSTWSQLYGLYYYHFLWNQPLFVWDCTRRRRWDCTRLPTSTFNSCRLLRLPATSRAPVDSCRLHASSSHKYACSRLLQIPVSLLHSCLKYACATTIYYHASSTPAVDAMPPAVDSWRLTGVTRRHLSCSLPPSTPVDSSSPLVPPAPVDSHHVVLPPSDVHTLNLRSHVPPAVHIGSAATVHEKTPCGPGRSVLLRW